jgi:hypothetical protein
MSRHVENVDDDEPKKKSKNISVAEIVEELKKDNLLFHDIEDGVGYIAVNKKAIRFLELSRRLVKNGSVTGL